jgi:GAF domain-containing protein
VTGLEPLPESLEALSEVDAYVDTDALLHRVREDATRVLAIVPSCVGLSIGSREQGITFTLVASNRLVAALDGVQYLFDGPCVAAVDADRVVATDVGQLLDEHHWAAFARATATAGIESTLTLPVLDDGQVVGSVNLYASTADAFTGHHEELAGIFGAWAPGAVRDADLGFMTRREAQAAPGRLRRQARIDTAVGLISAHESLDLDASRARLQEAAARAGVDEADLATAVIAAVEQRSRRGDAGG